MSTLAIAYRLASERLFDMLKIADVDFAIAREMYNKFVIHKAAAEGSTHTTMDLLQYEARKSNAQYPYL